MKSKVFLTALVCMFTTLAFSQQPATTGTKSAPTPEQRATNMTAKMKKDLNLNSTQEAQVKQINLDAAKRTDDIMKEAKSAKTDAKANLKTSEDQRDAALQKVLTSDQFAKYKQLKEEKKEAVKEKKAEKKAASPQPATTPKK